MALTMEQIQKLKIMLEEKKAKLMDYQQSVVEANPVNDNDRVEENEVGEDAQEAYDILASETLENTSTSMLSEIESALERIRHGTYGLDEKTGETIPFERLLMVPEARTTSLVEE
jgi:DnaK suppressor protein